MTWDKYDQTLTLEYQDGAENLIIEGRPIDYITGNTTLDNGYYTILVSGASVTLSLPEAYQNYGTIFKIKMITSGTTTIDTIMSDQIFDISYQNTYSFSNLGETITLQSDGISCWFVL